MSFSFFGVAAHRVDVELLKALFNPLEGGRVRAKHPLKQRRQKARAVKRPGIA